MRGRGRASRRVARAIRLSICASAAGPADGVPSGVPYGAHRGGAALDRTASPARARGARRAGGGADHAWLRRTLLAPARLVAGVPRTRGWLAFAAAPRRRRGACRRSWSRRRGTWDAVLVTGCVAETHFADTNHATAALSGARACMSSCRAARDAAALPLHLGARVVPTPWPLAWRARSRRPAPTGWSRTRPAAARLLQYDHLLPGDPAAAAVRRARARCHPTPRQSGCPRRSVALHGRGSRSLPPRTGQGVGRVRSLLAAIPVRLYRSARVGRLLQQRQRTT
jgi:hypothetical protein